MARKSSSSRVASKTSSATAFAASSVTSKPVKSAVLKSAFCPSEYQLSLFASVVQSLDSNQLRVHDTISGRLKCDHTPFRTNINCISWGQCSPASWGADLQPATKRRRKLNGQSDATSDSNNIVIAIGTSQPHIELFSPLEAKVVVALKDAHMRGTKDFKFKGYESFEAWSLGADGSLAQWDLATCGKIRYVARILLIALLKD
jgi:U3 small nucleolar RNA-associated protein 5